MITSGAEAEPAGDEANDLAPVVWEPGDGERHGDQRDDGQGRGAHHPVHTGQHPHPRPGERSGVTYIIMMKDLPCVEVGEAGPGKDGGQAEQESGQGQAGPGTQGRHNNQTS